MGVVMSIIHNRSLSRVKISKCKKFSSWTHAIYSSLKSFISGDPDSGGPLSSAEHVILIGFIIFSVLVLTAFTATATAFLVLNPSNVRYASIYEVIEDENVKVCTSEGVRDDLLYTYPGLSRQLVYPKMEGDTPEIFLEKITTMDENNRECDVAIMNSEEYESIILSTGDTYCSNTKIITDERLASIEVVLFFRADLDAVKSQIINEFNRYLEDNRYKLLRDKYHEAFLKANNDLQEVGPFVDEAFGSTADEDRNLKALHYLDSGITADTSQSLCQASNGMIGTSFSVEQMSAPFLITFGCTTLGLIIWFSDAVLKQSRLKQRMKKLFRGSYQLSVMEKWYIDESNLKMKYRGQPVENLLNEIYKYDVDEDLVEEAFNQLPDDRALVRLLIQQHVPIEVVEYQNLRKMTTYKLYKALKDCSNTEPKATSEIFSFSDYAKRLDAKEELIRRILANPLAKQRALNGQPTTSTMDSDSESDEFIENGVLVSTDRHYTIVSRRDSDTGTSVTSSAGYGYRNSSERHARMFPSFSKSMMSIDDV